MGYMLSPSNMAGRRLFGRLLIPLAAHFPLVSKQCCAEALPLHFTQSSDSMLWDSQISADKPYAIIPRKYEEKECTRNIRVDGNRGLFDRGFLARNSTNWP